MSKKKIFYSTFIVFLIITFSYGYYWGLKTYIYSDKESDNKLATNVTDKAVNASPEVVELNTTVSFYTKYKNCPEEKFLDEEFQAQVSKDTKFLGCSKQQLNELFKNEGYKVSSFSDEEVVLVKEIEGFKYPLNCYFIGIQGNYVVIYKKDNKGSIYVVEDKIEKVNKDENPSTDSAVVDRGQIDNPNDDVSHKFEQNDLDNKKEYIKVSEIKDKSDYLNKLKIGSEDLYIKINDGATNDCLKAIIEMGQDL